MPWHVIAAYHKHTHIITKFWIYIHIIEPPSLILSIFPFYVTVSPIRLIHIQCSACFSPFELSELHSPIPPFHSLAHSHSYVHSFAFAFERSLCLSILVSWCVCACVWVCICTGCVLSVSDIVNISCRWQQYKCPFLPLLVSTSIQNKSSILESARGYLT